MRGSQLLTPILAVLLLAGACSSSPDEPADETNESDSTGDGSDSTSADAQAECSPARPADAGAEEVSFDDDGTERSYLLTVPPEYDGIAPAPLVLDIHGFSSNAAQQSALTGMPQAAGERGYVVVTPQALEIDVPLTTGSITTTFWNIDPAAVREGFEPVDDLGFLDALLDDVVETLCIDTSREFVTGMSNGAGMTMALICGDDTRFAAAAPVAGVNLVGDCEPGKSIPLLTFHGDADPLIPYQGGLVVGQDYEVAGVEERVGELAIAAGCDPEPSAEQPFEDISTTTWSGCGTSSDDETSYDISLTTVLGGGHMWPGADLSAFDATETPEGQTEFIEGFDFSGVAGNPTTSIDATQQILDFFDTHSSASGTGSD